MLDEHGKLKSKEVQIETSSKCFANCIMCPRDVYNHVQQSMDTDFFMDIVRQAVELGAESLDLSGFGDSFVDPEAARKALHVHASYPELKLYTSSTAYAFTPEVLDWACRFYDTIKISHYGMSDRTFKLIHRLPRGRCLKNIHDLLSRSQRPYVTLYYLLLPQNQIELQPWVDYWQDLADEIIVWRPHNYGGCKWLTDTFAYRSEAMVLGKAPRSCGRPSAGNPYIHVNGDVSGCCYDFDHRLVIGNLKQDSLQDILSGPPLARLIDKHAAGDFRGICADCDQTHDRSDALVYHSNPDRSTNQPTSHPDHIVDLIPDP